MTSSFGARGYVRPLAGLMTIATIGLIIALTVGLFRGSLTETVPVTVISQRAGLVMNPDAKVKMRGVQVGKVDSIENRPDGTGRAASGDGSRAAGSDPVQRRRQHRLDDRVRREIRCSCEAPADPSPQRLRSRPGDRAASTSPSRSTRSSNN